MSVVVLLRQGESEWNAANVFTGWIDVGLSEHGEEQARQAGALLAADGYFPDVVHTSVQRRAIRAADLALAACGRSWVPVRRSWRLNSNHYGALQGRSKPEVRAEAGEEQYTRWRRGFQVRPPIGEPDDDPRYRLPRLELSRIRSRLLSGRQPGPVYDLSRLLTHRRADPDGQRVVLRVVEDLVSPVLVPGAIPATSPPHVGAHHVLDGGMHGWPPVRYAAQVLPAGMTTTGQ